MRKLLLILILFSFARPDSNAAYDPAEKPIKRVVTAGTYPVGSGIKISFLEYIPAPNLNGEKHPLIIFLHGQGERGTPGDTTTSNGVVKLYNTRIPSMIQYTDLPYFTIPGTVDTATYAVLAPQCSTDYGIWPPVYVAEMLKYAEQNLAGKVDLNRIYLVGLSQGGGGVLTALRDSLISRRIAAAVSICPGYYPNGDPLAAVARYGVPLFVFHAANDGTASITNPDGYILSLNQYGPAAAIQYTRFTDGGHNIWDRILDLNYGSWGITTGGSYSESETGRMWDYLLKYVNSPKRRADLSYRDNNTINWFNPLKIAA